ncbi:hypothetical protein GOBAR_AA28383 [Gossypium barbadense]|uniref:Uncharacterized protein n=1 Tax=Gossypium barbadense TaxID=3634 RepID=A0A2P5WMH7_GOSBA|nr:hypothetical protein GOBAR_AA28383 [Gossypium barbadense]
MREVSWKEKLLGRNGSEYGDGSFDGDLVIEDGDILRSSINGIPAIVFSECLRNILPWTIQFDPLKPFPSVIMAWIRFLGLSGFLYKKRILEEIGSLVGKVMKLDLKTDSGARGQFARMAMSVDLEKPLTSQVSINSRIQRVEFEALPTHTRGEGRLICDDGQRYRSGAGGRHLWSVDGSPVKIKAFGDWKLGVGIFGVKISGLKEVSFKQGDFLRNLKKVRSRRNFGLRAEVNKEKGILDHSRFIGLEDKSSGLVHLDVEQDMAGGRFKIAGNSRVPLPKAMNSMAKLFGEQVEIFSDKVITNDEGDKASIAL